MSGLALLALLAAVVDTLGFGEASLPADGGRSPSEARRVALATAAALLPATALAWTFEHVLWAAVPQDHLRLLCFALPVAVFASLAELLARRHAAPDDAGHERLALRATVHALLLGIAPLAALPARGLLPTLALAAGLALGFALLLALFGALRLRLALADVPARLRGASIVLVTAGLVALALLGFDGLATG